MNEACAGAGPERLERPTTPASEALAAKLAFLVRPGSYPGQVGSVRAVETHMSWVFLTERHAWKLKKPVHREGMDYRSPAARRRNCEAEVRLNRRLAPGVYLGVAALTIAASGAMSLDGPGRRIDWLVCMQRLPEALSLESLLRAGLADAGIAHQVLARLAPFFASARRERASGVAYRHRLVATINLAARELGRPEFGLARAGIERVAGALRHFVATRIGMLDARAAQGRVVEGHGDLRPEHVYLTDPPVIIDCIEFDRSLRIRDPADELAFLALEGERLGCPALDGWLFEAWRTLGADQVPRALFEFYKARNALVRARIAIWHLDDPAHGDGAAAQAWRDRANDYLHRAEACIGRALA